MISAALWVLVAASPASGTLLGRSFLYWPVDPPDGLRPLVIQLHGRMGNGEGMEKLSGLSRVATREKFLLVAPDGVERSWADARGTTPASLQKVDDVAFIAALIDLFIQKYGADPKAVYLVGMSNGAMMSLTLACALANKVTAVVAVTGLVSVKLSGACKPTRPVSVAFIVGDADPLVPYAGGAVARDRGDVLSAEKSAALWRKLDGCTAAALSSALPDTDKDDTTTTSLSRSAGCAEGTEVALFTVKGGGHSWPQGLKYLPELIIGKTSQDFSASEAAWEFLARHRR